jgi:hypothetical protein
MPCNTSRPGSSAFRPRSGSRRQRREEGDDSTIECETREIWPAATAATFRRDGDICFCVRPAGRVHTSDKTVFLGVPFRSGMTTCTSWAQYSNLRSDTYYVRLFRASVRRSILVHSVLVAQGDWPLLAADRGEVSRDAPPPTSS